MEEKAIRLAVKLAGILATSTLLATGTIVLLRSMSLDFNSVLYACNVGFSGAIVAGSLGFLIGKLFETSNPVKGKPDSRKKYGRDPEILIDDSLIEDLDKVKSEIE